MGPSLAPSSNTPLLKKRSMVGVASANTPRWVAYCGAFTEKMKSSGTWSRQLLNVSGFWLR